MKGVLIDFRGQIVHKIIESHLDSGMNILTQNLSHLNSGVYVLQLETADWMETRRIVLMK